MKKTLKVLIFALCCISLLSLTALAVTFPDVPRDGSERAKAIYKLADNGIVGGYEDGTFRPNGFLTRAELCKIVNLIFGYTEKDVENFKDVKVTDWYYNYVLVAKKAGYIGGFEDKTFRGQEKLTREQTCKIISCTAGLYDLPTATVVKDKISEWAKKDVMKVIANFVMAPDNSGNFRATENITRAELAMALDAFVIEKEENPSTPLPPSVPAGPTEPTVNKYTVKFYDGDGKVISTQTVEKGKSATAPTTVPTKSEDNEYTYTFAGWDKSFVGVTSSLNVYAKFNKTEKRYKVTLNYGDGTTGQTVTEIEVTYNGLLAEKLPTSGFKNGTKYFAGWYAGSELIDNEKYSDLTPKTLTAVWVSTFTVKFYNGDGSVIKSEIVNYGKSATAPTTKPSKATDNYYSYTFKEWDKSFKNVKTNLDVYPVFTETVRTYKVNLSYGSGTTGTKPASVTMTYDQLFADVLPVTGFNNGTKYFAGWYAGSELVDVEKYSDLKPTTLTAKWVSVFTVKFYDAKGNKIKEETVKYGESATAPANPTKAQDNEYTYTFAGWDTDFVSVTQNLDVHPVFTETERLYKITLNYGAGTTGQTATEIFVTYNTLLRGALPTSGFANGSKYFAGWYAGSELIDTELYSDLKPTSLTAKWVSTFTVKFYDAKGNSIKEEIVKYGESATAPAAPAKAQDNEYIYTFTGWDKTFTSVTSDLNVYPTYSNTERLYTVILDYGNGSTSKITMTYNQSFSGVLPTSGFENAGKLFAGWYSGSTLVGSEKYSDLKPTTLTAKWVSTFTVKFYNGNGKVMETRSVKYGGAAKEPSGTPTKAKTDEYTYVFDRWDTSFSYVTSDLDVYPIFTEVPRTYKVKLNYGEGVEDAITTEITVTYYEALIDYLPEDGFTRYDMLFEGWYDGGDLIDTECYADLSSSTLTAKWGIDPAVKADNVVVRAELQTVIDEIDEPLSFGFTDHQLWVLEPVVDAIQATLDESADGSRRISKAYVLENHSNYVSLASYRIRNPQEFDNTIKDSEVSAFVAEFKKNLKYDMANNLSTPSVNFLLDFFGIDVGDYID